MQFRSRRQRCGSYTENGQERGDNRQVYATTNLLACVLVGASSQMGIFSSCYSLLIETTVRKFECKLKAGLIPVGVGTLQVGGGVFRNNGVFRMASYNFAKGVNMRGQC